EQVEDPPSPVGALTHSEPAVEQHNLTITELRLDSTVGLLSASDGVANNKRASTISERVDEQRDEHLGPVIGPLIKHFDSDRQGLPPRPGHPLRSTRLIALPEH